MGPGGRSLRHLSVGSTATVGPQSLLLGHEVGEFAVLHTLATMKYLDISAKQ